MKQEEAVKVSVLVPVYNVKPYLHECLDSLAAQTLDSMEFVCIDDGSTDGCSEILDEYAERDARFRIIHKENSGYGKSMNIGLRAAKGTYIGIVESDDFADANMFSALYEAAENAKAEVVKSNYFLFHRKEGDAFRELLKGCPYHEICSARETPRILQTDTYVWTSIYRKDFLYQNDIWFHETPGAAYQDVAFTMKVGACSKRMLLIPEAYLHYREGNITSSVRQIRKKYHCFHDEFAEYWRFLRGRNRDERAAGGAAAYMMWKDYRDHCWPCVPLHEKVRYLDGVIHEFRQIEEEGFLRKSDWPEETWGKLQQLLHDSKEVLLQCAKTSQKNLLLKEGFLQSLRKTPKFYLYGAGRVAQDMMTSLQGDAPSPGGLLVSHKEENPEIVMGIRVYDMQEAPVDRKNDLIVISTSPHKLEAQQEIFFALVQAGFQNVIVLTEDLQQALSVSA